MITDKISKFFYASRKESNVYTMTCVIGNWMKNKTPEANMWPLEIV